MSSLLFKYIRIGPSGKRVRTPLKIQLIREVPFSRIWSSKYLFFPSIFQRMTLRQRVSASHTLCPVDIYVYWVDQKWSDTYRRKENARKNIPVNLTVNNRLKRFDPIVCGITINSVKKQRSYSPLVYLRYPIRLRPIWKWKQVVYESIFTQLVNRT